MNLYLLFRSHLYKISCNLKSFLSDKYWAYKITLVVLLLSLFFAFPSLGSGNDADLSKRVLAVQSQINDLETFWRTSEPTNAMFRITVPLIAKALGLGLQGTLVLQYLTGILIFLFVALITERETGDRLTAFYLTAMVGLIYPGCAAFLEGRFYFDSFAYLFLIAALWFRSPVIIGPLILLAGFTDERALIAAGFVFLWWVIQSQQEYGKVKSFINIRSMAVLIALLIYVILRLMIQRMFSVQTWSESRGEFLFFDQINNGPMGLWTGLEGGWLLVFLGCVALWLCKKWLVLFSFIGIISIQAVAGLAVVDITRSMGYLLPAVLVALLVLVKEKEIRINSFVMIAALISLLWPAYGAGGNSTIWLFYPFPIQVIRMILKL